MLKAAKKADRATNEGIVKVRNTNDGVVGVKLACETDFVAKNELFHQLAEKILDILEKVDKEFENKEEIADFIEENVQPLIAEYIGKIGENIRLLDAFKKKGNVYVYRHPGDKVVAIVFYEGGDENIAKEIALQVAAMNPRYISKEDIPQQVIDEMKEEFKKQLE
jgi:elongation factor Ts